MTFLSTWQTFIPSCQRGGSWETLLTFCFKGVTRVPWKAKENATFTNHLLLLLRVLNTTLFESWEIVGPYPSWWVFNLLLLLIQGLNCFWSYLIVKIACKAVSRGKVSCNSLFPICLRKFCFCNFSGSTTISYFIKIGIISSELNKTT